MINVNSLFCLRSTSRCLEALLSFSSLGSPSNDSPTWRVLHPTKDKKRTSWKLRVYSGLPQTLSNGSSGSNCSSGGSSSGVVVAVVVAVVVVAA